jgi:hypothetical protein
VYYESAYRKINASNSEGIKTRDKRGTCVTFCDDALKRC